MSKDSVALSKLKILEYNRKAHLDTTQLLTFAGRINCIESINAIKRRLEENNENLIVKSLGSMVFEKGRTIYLELEVVDSYMSQALYRWLFNPSREDRKPLEALGCILKEIRFADPTCPDEEDIKFVRNLKHGKAESWKISKSLE